MNDDLIRRQAAIEAINAVFPVDPMKSEYAQGIACGAALAKTYVEQLPSAQPEVWAHGEGELSAQPERKKGKWVEVAVTDGYDKDGIKTWISVMQCDQCGFIVNAVEGHMAQYNYCPNCGAQMGGDNDV